MEDRYEIKGKLGQGGLGAVYKAFDIRMNRDVAIKRIIADSDDANLSEEATRQLLQEAGSLASLQHPNIVTIYDVGSDEDGPFVVMELLTGETLDDIIGKGSFTWDDFRQLALQILEGLIAAQELHIVHRDLKPGNIMLTWLPSGKFQVKIVDFGLAKLSSQPSLQTVDQSDGVFGSIYFMAPEQFERVPINQQADLYAIGCVFYYALTGAYPFDGDSAAQVMAAHLQHQLTSIEEVRDGIPIWACNWIMWHLNRDPADRPESARQALQLFLENDAFPDSELSSGTPLPAPVAVKRPKLLIPGSAPDPEAPEVSTPTQRLKTASVPKPLAPPEGSKPSVHTSAQAIRSTPTSPLVTEPETPDPTMESVEAKGAQPDKPEEIQPAEQETEASVQYSSPILKRATPAASGSAPLLIKAGSKPAASPTISTAPAAYKSPATARSEITAAAETKDTGQEDTAKTDAKPVPLATPKPNSAAKVVLGIGLGLVALVLFIVLVSRMSGDASTERYNEMVALAAQPGASEIPVNSEDLDILLGAASSVAQNEDRLATYQALYLSKATDGTDIDQRIVDYATKTEVMLPKVRQDLLGKVLKLRKNPKAVAPLLSYARKSDDSLAAVAALEATRETATTDNFGTFVEIIQSNPDDSIRKAAEANAAALITKTKNKITFERVLLPAYESAAEVTRRHAILRLLGYVGGKNGLEIARQNLESDQRQDKIAALVALGNWSDDGGFGQLIGFLASDPDMQLRGRAFDSAMKFATGAKGNIKEVWMQLAGESKNQEEQLALTRGLANIRPAPWVFELLDGVIESADSDRVSDLATRAKQRLREIEKTLPKKKGK